MLVIQALLIYGGFAGFCRKSKCLNQSIAVVSIVYTHVQYSTVQCSAVQCSAELAGHCTDQAYGTVPFLDDRKLHSRQRSTFFYSPILRLTRLELCSPIRMVCDGMCQPLV